MRDKTLGSRWLAALAAVAMGSLGFCGNAAAAAGIAGTYTGIFQGGDNGTVTIVVRDDNTVTCDFYSSISAAHYASSGTVHTTSPFVLSCQTPANSPFLWTADSNNSSSVGISVSGLWGSDFGDTNNGGTFTAYYASTNTDTAGSIVNSSYSGFWYDPAFTGSGFNMINAGAGLLIAYYGWDAAGQRMWLTSDIGPATITNNQAITLKMSYTTGGTFNKPMNNHADWGTLTLIFQSCHAATAVLSGPDGTQNLKLTQLASVVATPGC